MTIDWTKPICLDTVPPRMAVATGGRGVSYPENRTVNADWDNDGRLYNQFVCPDGEKFTGHPRVRNVRPGDFADAGPADGWLIYKAGRGYYRPNAQGYTSSPVEAGRYAYADALHHSRPNGIEGPTDGITIKHESEVHGSVPATPDPRDAAIAGLVEALAMFVDQARIGKGGKPVAKSRYVHASGDVYRAARAALTAWEAVK